MNKPNWTEGLLEDVEGYRRMILPQIKELVVQSLDKPSNQYILARKILDEDTIEELTQPNSSSLHKQLENYKELHSLSQKIVGKKLVAQTIYQAILKSPQHVVFDFGFNGKAIDELTDMVYTYLLFQLSPKKLLDSLSGEASGYTLNIFDQSQVLNILTVYSYARPEQSLLKSVDIRLNEKLLEKIEIEITE